MHRSSAPTIGPYRFLAPVPAALVEHRPLPSRVDRNPVLIIFAYLRTDSAAAAALRPLGVPEKVPSS
jgi:hypothetical protein